MATKAKLVKTEFRMPASKKKLLRTRSKEKKLSMSRMINAALDGVLGWNGKK